jgi:hypothetical protein
MGDTMASSHRSVARFLVGIVGLGVFVASTPTLGAQLTTANTKWQAWIGCWQENDPTQPSYPTRAPVVCIVPATTVSAVDIVTVDSGKVVSRYTVDASGQQRPVNRDGCTGWESARWSGDNLRVFLSSELTCGALKRTSTGVMSISQAGEWVSVDAVKAGGNEAVRAVRYRDIAAPAQLPQEISIAATLGQRLDRRTAVLAASARLTPAMIIETMQATDTATVQAWLVERHETYDLTAKTLVAMADAGVPGSVTDVMIAASYPDEFHFTRGQVPSVVGGFSTADSSRIASDYLNGRNCDPLAFYSPYGWGVNPCGSYYNSYRYGYGYPGFGYGYGYGYGYSPYGYGYGYSPGYYSGYYTGPVVIVTNDGGSSHGRAVKGQGYTRSSSGSSGSSSGSGASTSASNGSSSGSSASGSAAGSSSAGSSSSSGRTAIPRPPT